MKKRLLSLMLTAMMLALTLLLSSCGDEECVNHVYTDNCDAFCDKCSAEREVGAHVYSSSCDDTCDECGTKRTAVSHAYDNSCDEECNSCGEKRSISHVYTDSKDYDCNVCGKTRFESGVVGGDGVEGPMIPYPDGVEKSNK